MTNSDKTFLVILDGWGIGKKDFTDGIFNAKTPFFNQLLKDYPNTTLRTFGNAVGLPEGQMGNSEVGHMNIGAGRVVWQQLELINRKFHDGSAADMPVVKDLINYCNKENKTLHLMGLLSNGGVHSSMQHLSKLCQILNDAAVKNVVIHAFTDGRDTDPKSAVQFVQDFKQSISNTPYKIATVIGRYYAMDRDQRWERVKLAYDLLVNGIGLKFKSPEEAIENAYANDISDEFIPASVITDGFGNAIATINEGDAVLCFNFRTDRGRQISKALTQLAFPDYQMKPLNIKYATMTEYDATYKNVDVIFDSKNVVHTLGEVISDAGKTQLRSAETEKYPHVTFFFSGGRELPFKGEDRIMEPSPKVPTYDLQAEMSAFLLTDKIEKAIESEKYDFICLNFANTDMVGHTGVWEAIIKAAETVDTCLQRLVEASLKKNYQLVIIADHGNSDEARNADGSPNTAHSMNPVPCIVISEKCKTLKENGKLADIAPTILKMMNLNTPLEMDGDVLF